MTESKIDSFKGIYGWLSNFADAPVTYFGVTYPSVENAYQATKTLDKEARKKLETCSAKEAKKIGKKLDLREDWEFVKETVMYELLLKKFAIPEYKEKLIGTGDAELIEGNWWGDTYWGVCNGKGKNRLGEMLMKIRGEYGT